MNGVIETSTGNLLRWGYTDFTNSLESGESIRSDVPEGAIRKGEDYPETATEMSRWDGDKWILVAQP